jgi:hypothetical protein
VKARVALARVASAALAAGLSLTACGDDTTQSSERVDSGTEGDASFDGAPTADGLSPDDATVDGPVPSVEASANTPIEASALYDATEAAGPADGSSSDVSIGDGPFGDAPVADGSSADAVFEAGFLADGPSGDGSVADASLADGALLDASLDTGPSEDSDVDGAGDATGSGACPPSFDAGGPTDSLFCEASLQCLACVQQSGCTNASYGLSCDVFPGSDESGCLAALACVLGSSCAATGTYADTPTCLCGSLDVDACTAPGATPNGPCASAYYAAFGTTDPSTILDEYYDTTVPGGMVNNIVPCVVSNCTVCFGDP